MNFKWWMKYTIKVLITPSCWIRNYQTSKNWDKKFLKLLEENKWGSPDQYTACLGDIVIWIANYPYASFNPCSTAGLRVLPSRKTAMYARERLEQDLLGDL